MKNIEELQKFLTVEQLPAMPHSALTVLQLDNDVAKVNINDLVRPIEADPGLAAQVLKFMNSSYFGFQSAISNVRHGITLVGIRTVKNFVLWKAVFSLIPKSKTGSFDISNLWQDSLRRAMFSRFLLLEIRKGDPELAFAGALLQDMAIPLLLKRSPQEYGDLLTALKDTPTAQLSVLESEKFGWTHADAVGVLGKNWKLPEPLINLMANHLSLDASLAEFEKNPAQLTVALSAMLPSVIRDDWQEKERFMKYYPSVLGGKSLPVEHFFAKVDKEFEQYAVIIQIAKPKRQLVEYL
ncbi:MAG: HDOD domain-containing protein [Planctomycetaceae bacterium]|nr:HDOD domain-containing protein [Planctomycetaceae bacterium]